ncbi:phosphodiesterase [Ignicoccus pacificus DSM 13166]|uniref:Phosphoesterase n=1 Tax=Ignicoccus pacificus DSM 13166 TaxID=940294 RepID=A0A977KB11_9CREN|nr:phosphodiesterase [Ignicoccus pacificus DSM 13166]
MGDLRGGKVKVLILSDAHVPDREKEIPKKILEHLWENKPYDLVLYAGDLTGEEVLSLLDSLGKEVHVVRGNMDYLPLPDMKIVELDGKRVLLLHGHQVRPRGNLKALSEIAKEYNASIIVHGHLHKPLVAKEMGVLHLNPGSVTGAWGGSSLGGDPTFMELYLPNWELRLYTLRRGGMEIKKMIV